MRSMTEGGSLSSPDVISPHRVVECPSGRAPVPAHLGYPIYWLAASLHQRRQPGNRSIGFFVLTDTHFGRVTVRGIANRL
jgi:hypothetical protein